MNVKETEPIDFFRQLFPEDLLNEMVHNINHYALQTGKENLALASEEMKTFLGINMGMLYIRYPRSRIYSSSEWASS